MRRLRPTLALLAALSGGLAAAADDWRDCPDCPLLRPLPAGSFAMGEAGRPDAEPVHTVTLRRFAIGKYEVTQREWQAVMGANPSRFVACGGDCPVEHVSWAAAAEYARRLGALTGRRYRLPSEAEWEYACRAGGEEDFCGGDSPAPLAWFGDARGGPHPVGGKQANAWGLHDMSGNLWEWTADCSRPGYRDAPADGSARDGDCKSRVLRGGSWLSGAQYSRAALRFSLNADYRAGDIGFRIVRELDE